MARAFEAKKSKAGKEIKCGRCQVKIEPGEQYFYFSTGFRGAKQIRCKNHPPKQSELTGSKMSGAYSANEDLDTAINTAGGPEDIANALATAAGEIESVRDEYQDSYDSLPENFQNGSQGEEIQEKIDGLSEYADKLNEAAQEVRDISESVDPVAEPDVAEDASEEDQDAAQQEYEEKLEAAQDSARLIAEDAMGEFSL